MRHAAAVDARTSAQIVTGVRARRDRANASFGLWLSGCRWLTSSLHAAHLTGAYLCVHVHVVWVSRTCE